MSRISVRGRNLLKKWKTVKQEYIYRNLVHGSIRKEKCLLPNGTTIEEYYISEFPNWVNAIVLTRDARLVLVRQYRHGAREFFLEIPGGTVEQNEDPVESIIREVQEETGYSTEQSPIFLGSFYPNPAVTTNRVFSYLFLDAEQTSATSLDETEELEIELVAMEEMDQWVKEDRIHHLFTVSAYLLAKNILN